MQEQIGSISEFLTQGDFHFRFFDMGRRVTRLSNQLFEKIENQQALHPSPFQQSAWLAVLFWDKHIKGEPVIWFLRFPIDELGYLQLSSRDVFIQQLMDQLGESLQSKQQGKPTPDSLKESPFAFKPNQDRLAIFHSKAAKELGKPASTHYAHTQNYLRGDIGYEQWEFLGLQGIADVVARLSEDNNEQLLTKALASIPDTPLEVICNMLEHVEPNRELSEALIEKLKSGALKNKNITLLSALTRALSNSSSERLRYNTWEMLLNLDSSAEIEILAALSGRAWKDLINESLLKQFLTALANCQQEQFNILLVDLMALPDMREKVLKVMRSPERTAALQERIGSFFQILQGVTSTKIS